MYARTKYRENWQSEYGDCRAYHAFVGNGIGLGRNQYCFVDQNEDFVFAYQACSECHQCVEQPDDTKTCKNFNVDITFENGKSEKSEMEWYIEGTNCGGYEYFHQPVDGDDFKLKYKYTHQEKCCINPGNYLMKCVDKYGDGWGSTIEDVYTKGKIKINGVNFCKDMLTKVRGKYIEKHLETYSFHIDNSGKISEPILIETTLSPATSRPSLSPTIPMPTVIPTTSMPSQSPIPTTSMPSQSPTTPKPSTSPSTSLPSTSPSTSLPSVSPTLQPSEFPTTSQPTNLPSVSPTKVPTTFESQCTGTVGPATGCYICYDSCPHAVPSFTWTPDPWNVDVDKQSCENGLRKSQFDAWCGTGLTKYYENTKCSYKNAYSTDICKYHDNLWSMCKSKNDWWINWACKAYCQC